MQQTILIVEDEFLIAMDLALMLEGDGWAVIGPVASVAAALRLLKEQLPSAAILDINLGNELITPLAKVLKACNVPFVISSAYDRPEHYGGDVLIGAPFVGKPVNERLLLATLRDLTHT